MDKKSKAIEMIKSFEGLKKKAYVCAGGKITIGYGTTKYPNGETVKKSHNCTTESATKWLLDYCEKNIFSVLDEFAMPDSVYISLSSFFYNCGQKKFALDCVVKKDYGDLADYLFLFVFVTKNGVKIPLRGLISRRRAEIKLFFNLLNSEEKEKIKQRYSYLVDTFKILTVDDGRWGDDV